MAVVYLGLIALLYMQFAAGEDPKRNRKVCFFIGIYLFVISAMKDINQYLDLVNYAKKFLKMRQTSYGQILESWLAGEQKDGVFYIVARFIGRIGFSYDDWMVFIALLFAGAVAWFIYRNSAKPVLSLMLLMTLDYYRFSLTGLRQVMAMSVIYTLSYTYLMDRRPWHFLGSVLLASLFHSSAILFLPAYLVATWDIGWKQMLMFIGTAILLFLFPNVVRTLIGGIAWTENMASYASRDVGLSWSGFIIQACVMAFCLLFRKDTVLKGYLHWRRVDVFLNCMIVGLCFLMISTMIAEAFRIAYYYNMCCIAAVSNIVVENKRKENHSSMYLIISLCLVAYLLWNKAYFDIKFYWQT